MRWMFESQNLLEMATLRAAKELEARCQNFDSKTTDFSLFLELFEIHLTKLKVEENDWISQLLAFL